MISKAADLGRIVAASAIFYFHIGIATGYPLSAWGEYAVAFFIISSGIAYASFSSVKPTDWPSYRRYLFSRVRAVFPIFITINVVIFISSFLHPSKLGRPFTFAEFLLSAAGLSQYFHQRYLSEVMWFIPFVMQMYLVLPFLDRLLSRVSGVLVILAAFAISLSLISLVFLLWPSHAIEVCRNWSILFRLPEVCIGAILGRCVLPSADRALGLTALVVFAFLSCVLATAVAWRFPPQAYILSLPWNGMIVSSFISIFAIAVAAVSENLRTERLLRLIGASSFPFFLAHGIAISFVFRRFGAAPTTWVFYFAFCWSAAIMFMTVFRYCEQGIRLRLTMRCSERLRPR